MTDYNRRFLVNLKRHCSGNLNFAVCALLVVILFCAPGCTKGGKSAELKSGYFNYSGYSEPQFKGFSKESRFVTMSDGVKVTLDIFLPTEGPVEKSFPVVLMYNPYNRAFIHPDQPWWQKIYLRVRYGIKGPVFDQTIYHENKLLLSHGYAVVVADMRGTGASFGSQAPFMPRLGLDGKEIVDWIAAQKWCNGNVGMCGQSYRGWSQLATAQHKPEALKCIMPEAIAITGYTEAFRPGGIPARRWIDTYSAYLNMFNKNIYEESYIFPLAPENKKTLLPCAPVVDEDNDGDLVDEVPVMERNDPSTFMDDGEPVYRDGQKREHNYYYRATMEHKSNMLFRELSAHIPFIDSILPPPHETLTSMCANPGHFTPEIMASGIAVYNIGGWFDCFSKGTVGLYATMKSKNPSKLLMAPRFHLPLVTDAYGEYLGYEGDFKKQVETERVRFFDRYLKGIDNGIDREQSVFIYVMNKGWRSENEWPLKRQKMTPFFFDKENCLSMKKPLKGMDTRAVDFTHSSSYGKTDISRWLMMFSVNGLMIRTEKDKKCLVYETAPLESDTEVTGHPIVDFLVSSNRPDGDFFVYITDVDEEGRSLYVTEGHMRAGWHRLHDDDAQAGGVVNVLPDLPWHGYMKGGYDTNVLAGGNKVELRFDLMPTSWLFKKGHRIRVAIAGADFPDFELNPVLSPENDPAKAAATDFTVYRGAGCLSRIELPVIPSK